MHLRAVIMRTTYSSRGVLKGLTLAALSACNDDKAVKLTTLCFSSWLDQGSTIALVHAKNASIMILQVLVPHIYGTTALSQYKDSLYRYGDSHVKIRRSQDRLFFNMGIPKLIRQHLHTDTAPRAYLSLGQSADYNVEHRFTLKSCGT